MHKGDRQQGSSSTDFRPAVEDWDAVWRPGESKQQYRDLSVRRERVLQKLGYFVQKGVRLDRDMKVLEAGCGDGCLLAHALETFTFQGYGLDFSSEALKSAERVMKETKTQFELIESDVKEMPFESDYFDVIISMGVVEHFGDPSVPLKEMKRVLKPGGVLIAMTPNSRSIAVLQRKFSQIRGDWPFGFQKEYSPKRLAQFASAAGLEVFDKEVVGRGQMSSEHRRFRIISWFDSLAALTIPQVGFYTYVFATKRQEISQ